MERAGTSSIRRSPHPRPLSRFAGEGSSRRGLRRSARRRGLWRAVVGLLAWGAIAGLGTAPGLAQTGPDGPSLATPGPASLADTWNVLALPVPTRAVDEEIRTDVCVVGGGSGGLGAALAAGRAGVEVLLIDRQRRLGGTGTNAFVCNWEPGPGCSIAAEMYRRMKALGGAGVAHGTYVDDSVPYEVSLVRALPEDRKRTRVPYSVPYRPEVFDKVAREMLAETGRVTVLDQTTFLRAMPNADRTRVESLLVQRTDGRLARVRAKVVIDATGDIWVARSLGCATMLGAEPKSRFNEPAAPEEAGPQLNAITRCYLIRASNDPKREPPPEVQVRVPKSAFVRGWQDDLLCINGMGMMPGKNLIDLGYDECLRRSEGLVRAHWHALQEARFPGYELAEIAPMLGIREGYRLEARYILTQHDLLAGLPNQEHDDLIAVADHPCDIHGAGGGLRQVDTAYGVPYRCLIPAGAWQNLLVACRGAGFSKIAASSVRLQRTMIQLGHAAGTAAAMAVQTDAPVDGIDVPALVRQLDARSRYPLERSFVQRRAATGGQP